MTRIKVLGPTSPINAKLKIGGSKSISNRVLLIRSLCNQSFDIDNLSDSDDTQTMLRLTKEEIQNYDVHHAGTCFRFLTARLAVSEGEQMLTGSSRMLQRPIGPLVEALRYIGADIEYMVEEGYPPLMIKEFFNQSKDEVSIDSGISSQFISALCMIAPVLPQGLKINLKGTLVSKPYLDMTLRIMKDFGVESNFENNTISIASQKYVAKDYLVESDWSSVSYHYAITALMPGSRIQLSHYFKDSYQGDSRTQNLYESIGVKTLYDKSSIELSHVGTDEKELDYNFLDQPDLVQTYAVIAAGLGLDIRYKGVQTLAIKETDRMSALQSELSKVGIRIIKSDDEFDYAQSGKVKIKDPIFDTYEDHRMAMAMAPLAIISPIYINNPKVVTKSYPNFWNDLVTLGFTITSE